MVSFRQAEDQSMKALEDRREQTRRDFFKGREDVSSNRLDRRQIQDDLEKNFIATQMKPVENTGGTLLQKRDPSGMGLSEYRQMVANKYGPTPREVFGDMGRGLGSMVGGFADRIQQGNFGVLGIAKNLFNQVKNKAAQTKNFLGEQVNKLSDIDLEIFKNRNNYKKVSQKPELQNIYRLEEDEKSALQTQNILGNQISTMENLQVSGLNATQKSVYNVLRNSGQPHEVAFSQATAQFVDNRPLQEKLQDISTASNASLSAASGVSPQGDQYLYASENSMNNLTESGQMIYDRMKNLNMSPERINERMQEINESNLSRGTLGPLFAAEGGSVDKKLNDIQKKTNNIYGTGILSVR